MCEPRICIIGGLPRAGTRQFMELANGHESIHLFGELGKGAISRTMSALKDIEIANNEEFERRKAKGILKFKFPEKYQLALTLLAMYSKNPYLPYNDSDFNKLIVGFKHPQIENQWTGIQQLLGSCQNKNFFFCARNLDLNYLSLYNLGWRDNIEEYTKRVIMQFTSLLKVHDAYGETWNIKLLHLDSYIKSEDRSIWLTEKLFNPLSINSTPEYISNIIAKNPNKKALRKPPARQIQLSDKERIFLEKNHELRNILNKVNETFSVDIRLYND